MAIGVVMDFDGATLEQYDQVIDKMHLTPGAQGPPGALFHWCAVTESGIRVIDVWQTREQFDAFAQDQIGPKTAEVGLPGPPDVTFHDVHNHFTEGGS
jgi:hypothetical protein